MNSTAFFSLILSVQMFITASILGWQYEFLYYRGT